MLLFVAISVDNFVDVLIHRVPDQVGVRVNCPNLCQDWKVKELKAFAPQSRAPYHDTLHSPSIQYPNIICKHAQEVRNIIYHRDRFILELRSCSLTVVTAASPVPWASLPLPARQSLDALSNLSDHKHSQHYPRDGPVLRLKESERSIKLLVPSSMVCGKIHDMYIGAPMELRITRQHTSIIIE